MTGKSTLQNEMIGDLDAEFGNLPDDAENVTTSALCTSLNSSFSGQFGKVMSKLVSRLISTKMPAGFNQAAFRGHLSSHWGLGDGRQMAVICFAATIEPPSRLADVPAAKEYVDSVALRYAKHVEIAIFPGERAGGTVASEFSAAAVNPASIEAANKQQKEYLTKQYEVLAQYLEMDQSGASDKVAQLQSHQEAINARLDLLSSELDDDFTTGVEPKFNPLQLRKYDASWNWVREDLIALLNSFYVEEDMLEGPEMDERLRHLQNRWESACDDIIDFYSSHAVSILQPNLRSYTGTTYQPKLKARKYALRNLKMQMASDAPAFKFTRPTIAPKTTIDANGKITYEEVPRKPIHGSRSYPLLIQHGRQIPDTDERIPYVHLRRNHGEEWLYHAEATNQLMEALIQGCDQGLSFVGKIILITGAGPNSIGAEVVKGLVSGGAEVIVTTSRTVSDAAEFFNGLSRDFGARGSSITLLPFNQGSKNDCESLIEYIYDSKAGMGIDLDFIVPFAAISEPGREIDALDSKSELAHRLMLTNLVRLLGFVKQQKARRGFDTWPTNVILPLSPNHGTFGGDGLYGESKIALESLLSRWYSESWSEYLTLCGAVIGWTRGTGLMSGNNIVAEKVEAEDVLTFSQSEMGYNILALMTPTIAAYCEDGPIYADLNGGVQFVHDLKTKIVTARQEILDESRLRKALHAERVQHEAVLKGTSAAAVSNATKEFHKLANFTVGMPELPDHQHIVSGLQSLQGMIDLSRVVVVVGYSELGPWGSERTRWEMEHLANFSQEGYIEMAWIMGLVKHFTGEVAGKPYSGWIDANNQKPVHDDEFRTLYREEIMKHSGIRITEPEGLGGYDASKKEFLSEVVLEKDLPPIEASKATAEAFKLRHGDRVKITPIPDSEDYKVHMGKGVHFLVPKAQPFDRRVAGQLPRGWDPTRYGVPKDIVEQVDPITVYALCCTAQALLNAGIEDAYELYKHIHVSELANCLGTGAGGMLALRDVYRSRYMDRPVQSDIIQESYNNAHGAWVNMLLLGATGPICSPSGTCATAVESLNAGCEIVQNGKAKVALVGGTDDFQEEMSHEFGSMNATASSEVQDETGRLPSEMSRPMTSSRGGFIESAGCGVQLIMSAELALKMGLPVYGIIAYTQIAGDKIGRSIPAPGQGLLTAARESREATDSPYLDLAFRQKSLRETIASIEEWRSDTVKLHKHDPNQAKAIDNSASCRIRDAQNMWFNDIRKQDPEIAPIRAALATWALNVDDIQVATLHGTSTRANDTNESSVLNQQMEHLDRTLGNPLLAISQKYLTGHPKGAAGAWMLNGCLQVLQTGIIPGNRNGDNIDPALKRYTHLVYPTNTLRTPGIKAFMLTSFGFGQKGGLVVGLNPKFLFAAIEEETYEDYRRRMVQRKRRADRALVEGIIGNSLFKAKEQSSWHAVGESQVFLDPKARIASPQTEKGEYLF